MSSLQPHQERVVTEKAELDEKLNKLTAFIGSQQFSYLCDTHEQVRLRCQAVAMTMYSQVLGDRINAFTNKEPA